MTQKKSDEEDRRGRNKSACHKIEDKDDIKVD